MGHTHQLPCLHHAARALRGHRHARGAGTGAAHIHVPRRHDFALVACAPSSGGLPPPSGRCPVCPSDQSASGGDASDRVWPRLQSEPDRTHTARSGCGFGGVGGGRGFPLLRLGASYTLHKALACCGCLSLLSWFVIAVVGAPLLANSCTRCTKPRRVRRTRRTARVCTCVAVVRAGCGCMYVLCAGSPRYSLTALSPNQASTACCQAASRKPTAGLGECPQRCLSSGAPCGARALRTAGAGMWEGKQSGSGDTRDYGLPRGGDVVVAVVVMVIVPEQRPPFPHG